MGGHAAASQDEKVGTLLEVFDGGILLELEVFDLQDGRLDPEGASAAVENGDRAVLVKVIVHMLGLRG